MQKFRIGRDRIAVDGDDGIAGAEVAKITGVEDGLFVSLPACSAPLHVATHQFVFGPCGSPSLAQFVSENIPIVDALYSVHPTDRGFG